jgi:hypothetical protein
MHCLARHIKPYQTHRHCAVSYGLKLSVELRTTMQPAELLSPLRIHGQIQTGRCSEKAEAAGLISL